MNLSPWKACQNTIVITLFCLLLPIHGFSQENKDLYFGFTAMGNLIGFHNMGSDDIEDLSDEGWGEIKQKGYMMGFGAGLGLIMPNYLQATGSIAFYLGGGGLGFNWKNVAETDEDVSMSVYILDIRYEMKLRMLRINEFIIAPCFGIGKTLYYNFVDEEGDGFIDGGGDAHYLYGISIIPTNLISRTKSGFWEISFDFSIIRRPSFSFDKFKIGESVSLEFEGKSTTAFLLGVSVFWRL